MITLCTIDKNNWVEFAEMQLSKSQKMLVASNAMTIAESKFYPHQVVIGICKNDKPVGLVAYCEDDELQEKDYWIYRFMVDKRHQNKGIGKLAFELVLRQIASAGAKRILTMCKPENEVAFRMYQKAGFVEAGTLDDGDTFLEMPLNKSVQPIADASAD